MKNVLEQYSQTENPLTFKTTFKFDKVNRQTSVTNPESETSTTVYDAAGRTIATVNPLTFRTTTTYDKADRPTAVTNPENETTTTAGGEHPSTICRIWIIRPQLAP